MTDHKKTLSRNRSEGGYAGRVFGTHGLKAGHVRTHTKGLTLKVYHSPEQKRRREEAEYYDSQ